MDWLTPYINETVERIEESANEFWDFFIDNAEGDFSEFYKYKNSFGKSALYANVALGLSIPEISDELSNNMGASSPKTPTGKEEMIRSNEGFFSDMGKAMDVADRIVAEWHMSGQAAGGYDQGDTRTYENIRKLIAAIKRGPVRVKRPQPQPVPVQDPMQAQMQSLLIPEA